MKIPTTPATPESVWAVLMENAQQQKVFAAEFEARQREYEAARKEEAAEHARQWQELKEHQDRISQNLDRISQESDKHAKSIAHLDKNMGGLNNSIGEIMEILLAARIWEKFNKVYGYNFKDAYHRRHIFGGDDRLAEIDILICNGEYVMGVEVKNKLSRTEDVDVHVNRLGLLAQHPYPDVRGKKVLGSMACGIVSPSVRDYAFSKGLFVVSLTGDTAQLEPTPADFAPHEWLAVADDAQAKEQRKKRTTEKKN